MLSNILKNTPNGFLKFNKYFFSLKKFKTTTDLEGRDLMSSWDDNKVKLNEPLNVILAALGGCTIHSISAQAKSDNIKIEDIKVEVEGNYDTDYFKRKKEGRNTYENIDVNVSIKVSESDKSRIYKTLEGAEVRCPILQTLKLAGIKINITKKLI
jgi:uncharacterized OsmC-like protein